MAILKIQYTQSVSCAAKSKDCLRPNRQISTEADEDVLHWLQVDLSRYTLSTYLRIVTYKTAFYSFYLPVACGLVVAGKGDAESLKLAKDICIQMGQYFQVSFLSQQLAASMMRLQAGIRW